MNDTTSPDLRERIDQKIRHPLLFGLDDPCGPGRAGEWADHLVMWVMEVVQPEMDQLKALTATCACGTPGMDYEGLQADCPVHGAVRGLQEAQAALASVREAHEASCVTFVGERDGSLVPGRSHCLTCSALAKVAPAEATR
jgi:hypothetical protein